MFTKSLTSRRGRRESGKVAMIACALTSAVRNKEEVVGAPLEKEKKTSNDVRTSCNGGIVCDPPSVIYFPEALRPL